MILIPVCDLFLLAGIIAGAIWWQKKHGQLTHRQVAFIASIYGTVFVITSVHPIYLETHYQEVLIFELVLLLIVWLIGYPFASWLYKQFLIMRRH